MSYILFQGEPRNTRFTSNSSSRTKGFADKCLEPTGKLEAAGGGLTEHVEVMKGLLEQLLALLSAVWCSSQTPRRRGGATAAAGWETLL